MQWFAELPPLPKVEVRALEDRSDSARGFLWRRSRLISISVRGVDLGSLVYDEVDRAAIDAVVVTPYFEGPGPNADALTIWVVLRSAVRPPVTLREDERSPLAESGKDGLWEVPAGLIEADEASAAGIRRAAARELAEETGFVVAPEALSELGPPTYPAPGVLAERHFFFSALVNPASAEAPTLDGSPLEAAGEVIAVPLAAALKAARAGHLADAKTEIAVRRLAEQLGEPAG